MLGQDFRGIAGAIGSHQFALRFMPEQNVPIVFVERVEIAALVDSFAGAAKGQLAHAPDFQQHLRHFTRGCEIDGEVGVFREAASGGQGCNFALQNVGIHRGGQRFLDS